MSICAENITWKVGKKVIVNDVSLKVSRGETVGLLGPTAAVNRLFYVSSRACVARMRAA
jgi:ABC-type lipopolysaccharide export system ATPase subunit